MGVAKIMEANARQFRIGYQPAPFERKALRLQWQAVRACDNERVVSDPDPDSQQRLRLCDPMPSRSFE